jgi:predicted metal-dependent HD superfamily phosphohydrolase
MRTKDNPPSSTPIQEIRNRWFDFCNRLKISTTKMKYCIESFKQLHMHYSKQNRAYHNWSHIIKCLIELNEIKGNLNYQNEVEMALWFHDVIYEPGYGGNEENSAKWAVVFSITIGMSELFAKRVRTLILATKHNKIPKDTDARFVVDIDLSILGQPEADFLRYEGAIREEYSALEDEYFKQRRIQLLQYFLDRDFIYLTNHFRKKYEKIARKNLKHSIERLKT